MQGKEVTKTSVEGQGTAGIDVCKDWLDAHIHPAGVALRVANDKSGIRTLKAKFAKYGVELTVMEATGKWHRAAHRSLHQAGFSVAVVNPYRSREFAGALGQLAKTDKIDARTLALYGAALKPDATLPSPTALAELSELVVARSAAKEERTALSNRQGAAESKFLIKELKRRGEEIDDHIKNLDTEIDARIKADKDLARRYEILISIPGVGPVTASLLIAALSELGSLNAKQISSLAGLAPMNWDSGTMRGQRHIAGGRAHVRKALYMAAVAAARFNPALKIVYERLRNAGKKPKLALIAIARKLVILANTLIAEDRLWTENAPKIR
jgi:transposase